MQADSPEPVGDLPSAEQRKEGLELLHQGYDEVGKTVDGQRGRLKKRVLVELAIPVGDRDGTDEKFGAGSSMTPAARLLDAEDGEALKRRVVRARDDFAHALLEEADLFSKECRISLASLVLDFATHCELRCGVSPSAHADESVVSESESGEETALDVFVPRLGQRDFRKVERFHDRPRVADAARGHQLNRLPPPAGVLDRSVVR
jgi:hypothetical protein